MQQSPEIAIQRAEDMYGKDFRQECERIIEERNSDTRISVYEVIWQVWDKRHPEQAKDVSDG